MAGYLGAAARGLGQFANAGWGNVYGGFQNFSPVGNFAPRGFQGNFWQPPVWTPPQFVSNDNWQGFPAGNGRGFISLPDLNQGWNVARGYEVNNTAPWGLDNVSFPDLNQGWAIGRQLNLDNDALNYDNFTNLDFRDISWQDDMAPVDNRPVLDFGAIRTLLSKLQDNSANILGDIRGSIQGTLDAGNRIRQDVYANLNDVGITINNNNPFADLERLIAAEQGASTSSSSTSSLVVDGTPRTLDSNNTWTGDDGSFVSLTGSGTTDLAGMTSELSTLLNTLNTSFGGSLGNGNLGNLGQHA